MQLNEHPLANAREQDPYVSPDDADLDPETAAQYRLDRMAEDLQALKEDTSCS